MNSSYRVLPGASQFSRPSELGNSSSEPGRGLALPIKAVSWPREGEKEFLDGNCLKQLSNFDGSTESTVSNLLPSKPSLTARHSQFTFSTAVSETKENLPGNQSLATLHKLLATRKSLPHDDPSRNSLFSNSCQTTSSSLEQHPFQLIRANSSIVTSQGSGAPNDRSSTSSTAGFKGDRFIPFRGTTDTYYMEEFMLNNEDPFLREQRKRASTVQQRQEVPDLTATPVAPSNDQLPIQNSGSASSSTQYSLGSGHKKRQSFQELITESLFTKKRGSPNTLTLQEAEEEELRFSRLPDGKKRNSEFQENQGQQRILNFKEKRQRPSMSLHNNISLIQTLAQEKTHRQQKNLRCIPQFPEKILDAPDLVDDYYLNLLDWSQGNVLAVCLAQTVYLWNAVTGEIKQLFDTENDNDIVTSVAWMKGSSNVLAIGTSSKQLHLLDANQFARIKTIEGQHDGRIGALSWNPTFSHLLSSGSLDSMIHTNDIRLANGLVCTYQYHRQEVCGLKWSHDGQQLASGGNDNMLCIWDINTRMRGGFYPQNFSHPANVIAQPRFFFSDHKAAVKALAWCPWQRHLLASGGGSRDQTIKFWNTESGSLLQSVQTESQVCSLLWNPFDREILSSHGFVNNQLCIWKYPQMKKIADLRGHTSRVLHLSLSPDGTTVASAAADETLRFWKVFQNSGQQPSMKPQPPQESVIRANVEAGSEKMASEDVVMTECTKSFFQASPSQFNGFRIR